MRKPRQPVVFVMWCIVAAIGLIGLAVALISIMWQAPVN